jgi:hypothetical protein
MSFVSAAAKRMNTVTHYQQLQRIPSCLKRLEAIGIIDLPRKVSYDPFNDIIGSRHASMEEMGTRVRNLFQEGERLRPQSTDSPCPPMTLKEIHPLAPLLQIRGIKDLVSHLQKLLHTSSTALVLIAKVVKKKLLYMTDAKLYRHFGKNPAGRSPKAQIPSHDKALQWIVDSVSKGIKTDSKPSRFSLLES